MVNGVGVMSYVITQRPGMTEGKKRGYSRSTIRGVSKTPMWRLLRRSQSTYQDNKFHHEESRLALVHDTYFKKYEVV